MRCRKWIAASALCTGLLAAALMAAAAAGSSTAPPAYEMEVLGVAPDPQSGAPVVFLRAKEDKRQLSMFIGPFEAQGIILALQGTRLPRPYTHDLMLEAIHRLQAKVERVVITAVKDNTFLADLILVDARGRKITLDARPSDAIALALRDDSPILAEEPAFLRSQQTHEPQPRQQGQP
jgi:bifunctional DNase/RNase